MGSLGAEGRLRIARQLRNRRLLSFRRVQANEPFLKRIARGELIALLLNVVSGKVSQTQVVAKDGITLSQKQRSAAEPTMLLW